MADLPPILPMGTAVVLLVPVQGRDGTQSQARGAVGVIVHSPVSLEHSYRVRFMGGDEASVKREELAVLSHFKQEGLEQLADPLHRHDLTRHVIYRCIVGSRAYGLEREGSDTDRRGIYLPPADMHWSIFGVPEQLENDETQECYWELEKFLLLALKANPNVLECLYSPMVEHATEIAQELLAMRDAFLSKLVYQTYNGYVLSQFKKLEHDVSSHGALRWKHAMHLIRLLMAGIKVIRDHAVLTDVGEHRELLLAIRDGQLPWDELNRKRIELHREFDNAFSNTTLPDWPDYDRVNHVLIRARRSML
ncbi:MAG: nucleotidyltransferase domain-containing protein [Planctomycetota bacterium]